MEWGQNGCSVLTKKGLLVEARHVISSLPIGVPQAKHREVFYPSLGDEMEEAIVIFLRPYFHFH